MERCPEGRIWTKTPWILTNACDVCARRAKEKWEQVPQCRVWLCVTIHRELPSDPLETDYSNNYSDVLWEI